METDLNMLWKGELSFWTGYQQWESQRNKTVIAEIETGEDLQR